MPLAAVGLFIMTLGVLATLNLGQAVYEKIKLQNTADSAAYTLAAIEARTFNYIAFLNRTQIAHYNTAMVIQSYLSWAGFYLTLFGLGVDMDVALRKAAKQGEDDNTSCPKGIKCLYTAVKVALMAFEQLYVQMRKMSLEIYERADKEGHELIEAIGIFNRDVVYQTQLARAVLINAHIASGMQSYISDMDPELSFTEGESSVLNYLVNMALNSIEYYQTFDNAGGLNPSMFSILQDLKNVYPVQSGKYYEQNHEKKFQDAWGIMAELCHATRTPRFVSNRSGSATVSLITPAFIIVSGGKMGQTKFTKKVSGLNSPRISEIGDSTHYPDPPSLSSDDYLTSGNATGFLGLVFGSYMAKPNSLGDAITAYKDSGDHYYYDGQKKMDPMMMVVPMPSPSPDGPKLANHSHDSNRWPGFAPFIKFKPKADSSMDYNQPSTWIFLNKSHKDFQTKKKRAPWFTKFTWKNGQQIAELDTTIGGSRNSYFLEGVSVLSRGMAYYHRRGNWTEHPNFFNPFWRARLAPVGQKLQSFWDRWVTSKMTTSSDDAVVKAMVNILRNAQMDLFTSFITGLITH
jgi:hypothetical protein